jgi:hypothetical protein
MNVSGDGAHLQATRCPILDAFAILKLFAATGEAWLAKTGRGTTLAYET